MTSLSPKFQTAVFAGAIAGSVACGLATGAAYYHFAPRPETIPETVSDLPGWLSQDCVVVGGPPLGAGAVICKPMPQDELEKNFRWVRNDPQSFLEEQHIRDSENAGLMGGATLFSIFGFALFLYAEKERSAKTPHAGPGPLPF